MDSCFNTWNNNESETLKLEILKLQILYHCISQIDSHKNLSNFNICENFLIYGTKLRKGPKHAYN